MDLLLLEEKVLFILKLDVTVFLEADSSISRTHATILLNSTFAQIVGTFCFF